MNKEQLFWMAIIIVLNIAAYLVGKHEGSINAYHTMATLLDDIAPNEMDIIRKKIDNIDPYEYAFGVIRRDVANKEKSNNE